MKITNIYFWLAIICLVITMTSCSDDSDAGPRTELSLEVPRYTLGNEEGDTVNIAVITEGKALSTVRIPYRLSSSKGAVLNRDFEISDSAFTLHEGDSIAYLKVTRKHVDGQKSFLLTLLPVEGVKLGALNYIEVELLGNNIYTFVEPTTELALSKDVTVRVETALGQRFLFPKKTRLDVEVDPSSTAVEGVHFTFKDNQKKAVFNRNKHEGAVSVVFLKKEAGKDHIVLRLSDSNKLAPGAYPTIDIRIVGPTNLSGTWSFEGVANESWWRNSWSIDPSLLIDTVKTDRIILKGNPAEGYEFTPQLTGKLKNYFTGPSFASFIGERENYLQEEGVYPPPKVSLAEYRLDNINVAFDEAHSNIRKTFIGFRLLRGKNNGKILELNIYDIEPVEPHWKDLLESMKYNYTEPPYFVDSPIRLHFKEVK